MHVCSSHVAVDSESAYLHKCGKALAKLDAAKAGRVMRLTRKESQDYITYVDFLNSFFKECSLVCALQLLELLLPILWILLARILGRQVNVGLAFCAVQRSCRLLSVPF